MMARIALFTREENGCWNAEKTGNGGAVKVSTDKNLLVCWNHLHVRGRHADCRMYDSIQRLLGSFIKRPHKFMTANHGHCGQALCYFGPLISSTHIYVSY